MSFTKIEFEQHLNDFEIKEGEFDYNITEIDIEETVPIARANIAEANR